MHQRGFFWKLFIGQVLLLSVILFAGVRMFEREVRQLAERNEANATSTVGPLMRDAMRTAAWMVIPLAIVVSVVYSVWATRAGRQPLEQITEAARDLARGELSKEVPMVGTEETLSLAGAMNRMRERLARHLETINRQRLTLESLVAQVHEGVLVVDPNGRIVTVNPAAVRLLDLRSNRQDGSFDGMPVEQCVLDHDVQQLLLRRPGDESYAVTVSSEGTGGSGRGRTQPVRELNLRVESEEGERSLLARASDIVLPGFASPEDRGDAGSHPGRLLVLTDITEFSKTIQVKADFAANASHELRTPLSAIRMAVETLKSMDLAQDAAPAVHFLDVIARHSRRLEEMVKDLLDLSRVESPGARFEREEVSTRELLDDIREAFGGAILDKDMRWDTQISSECGRLLVNPVLIRLTLTNLVENAIKFTGAGGAIRVDVQRSSRGVEFLVSDTGCGIAPEEQSRVFERFYQVMRARSGSERGTGLGLSIVRHAVVAMGGEVSLTSVVGEGTTVRVVIPQTNERVEQSEAIRSFEQG